jgi:flavin reductase (DIM6/NTAB) family NADH-FMN oxidoreductase RutF
VSDPAEAFHRIVDDLDYPMYIVTAAAGADRGGCLVGFTSQCSIHPPRVGVWISKANHTYDVARTAEGLVVHVPSAAQRDLAERFGSRTGDEEDPFAGTSWRTGPFGCPVIDEVERWFAGRVAERSDTGDHLLLVLDVVAAEAGGRAWPGQLGFQAVKDLDPGHEP